MIQGQGQGAESHSEESVTYSYHTNPDGTTVGIMGPGSSSQAIGKQFWAVRPTIFVCTFFQFAEQIT